MQVTLDKVQLLPCASRRFSSSVAIPSRQGPGQAAASQTSWRSRIPARLHLRGGGSDQEDWFRAEAKLKNALVAKCEELSRHPLIPRYHIRTESETRTEFRWTGHWEVWEMEWNEPAVPRIREN